MNNPDARVTQESPASRGERTGSPAPHRHGAAAANISGHQDTATLADVTGWSRALVKGRLAGDVLAAAGLPVPADIYQVVAVDADSAVIRTGGTEFWVEDSPLGSATGKLPFNFARPGSAICFLRQDASFILGGPGAMAVLNQACGLDPRTWGRRLVFTRVAGVSCGALVRGTHRGQDAYQLWLDPTYRDALWHNLELVVHDLGGSIIDQSELGRLTWTG